MSGGVEEAEIMCWGLHQILGLGEEPVKVGGYKKGEMWVSHTEARCAGLPAAIAMAQMVVLEVCCGNMGRSWLIGRKI